MWLTSEHEPSESDESSALGQDTQANRVPQPYAALANARAHGFIVATAGDDEIQDAWRHLRGPRSVPFGRLLVIASVSNYGRERRLWVARSALAPSAPQHYLLGRAIERAVQSELHDVSLGTLVLLERRGTLVAVPYIYRRYEASVSRTAILTLLSWCCVSVLALALTITQRPLNPRRRIRRARRRTPALPDMRYTRRTIA